MVKPTAESINVSNSASIVGPETMKKSSIITTTEIISKKQTQLQTPPISLHASRREMRKQRQLGLLNHNSKKPHENDDDPRDLLAIKIAERTIGDYKLKVAEDYEISEENRVNAKKKRGEMALLEESMVLMRLQFNDRFLALRELKRQIIYSILRDNERIRSIDAELGQPELSQDLWKPTLDPEEYLDDFDEVSGGVDRILTVLMYE